MEPELLAVISCSHVIKDQYPILLVSHDIDDGGWQFLCGKESHSEKDAIIIGLGEILEMDPTVNDIADLEIGFIARRKLRSGKWTIEKSQY